MDTEGKGERVMGQSGKRCEGGGLGVLLLSSQLCWILCNHTHMQHVYTHTNYILSIQSDKSGYML